MNIRNPLINYLNWFKNLSVDSRDDIAYQYFTSFNTLKRSYSYLDVSKEEFDQLNEEDIHAELDIDVESDDFESEIGKESEKLLNYLTKFIEFDDRRFIEPIAQSLFIATEVNLLDFKPVIDCEEIFQNKHIESLLLGNKEEANRFEEMLNEGYRSKMEKKITTYSWNELKKEGFNLSTIHDYNVDDYFKS